VPDEYYLFSSNGYALDHCYGSRLHN